MNCNASEIITGIAGGCLYQKEAAKMAASEKE
jgi:hypothetical protein